MSLPIQIRNRKASRGRRPLQINTSNIRDEHDDDDDTVEADELARDGHDV